MPWFQLSDGVPLWYEDQGAGPVILLVPGWTYTTRFYDFQVADLCRDHRVVSVDLRGAGNSGKTPDGHSLSQYAADIIELSSALGLRDITAVGWAMAVSVLVHAIQRSPNCFSRLVWVDHSPRFFIASDWAFALNGNLDPWTWDTQVRALQDNRPAATRALLVDCFWKRPSDTDLDWMTAELLKTPTEVMTTMLATVANVDLRPLLVGLTLPVLCVNGRHSMVPVEVGAWLATTLPRARCVVMEKSGHQPYLEEPDRFNQLIRDFAREDIQ
jgi:non-heme chloroperoxidase